MHIPPALAVSLACLPLVCLAACDKREGITVRQEPLDQVAMPLPAQADQPAQPAPGPMMPKTTVGAHETLWVGAVPAGDDQWVTFKTIAPSVAIAKHAADLESILNANDGTLPVGWTQEEVSAQAAKFGRLATFRSPAPEITVAVNRAGGSVASNINRWRGQAGLAELPEAEAAAQVKKLANGGWVFAVAGKVEDKTESTEKAPTAPETQGATIPAATALAFSLPAGWTQVQPSSDMRLAQFSTGSGDEACTVAITRFPGLIGGSMGSTLDNINRWRGQLKLAPWQALPAQLQAVPVTISGAPGVLLPIAAAEGEPVGEQAMLVAFAADSENTYFIKLTGKTAPVEAQLSPLTEFLKSLKLPMTAAPAPLPADLKLLPAIKKEPRP